VGRPEDQRLAMHLYGSAMAIADPIRVRMWAEAELTTGQIRVLVLLRSQPGASLSWLAGQTGVSLPTASGLLDRLVRQGYARREEDVTDRRIVRHHLTERGAAIVSEIEREGVALFERILGRLSDEGLTALIQGLTLLTAAAAKVAREPADAEVQA
jgi:DNA-binding MarR family transcriptional regulator